MSRSDMRLPTVTIRDDLGQAVDVSMTRLQCFRAGLYFIRMALCDPIRLK